MNMLSRANGMRLFTAMALTCASAMGGFGLAMAGEAGVPPILEAETVDVATLPPVTPHRLFSLGGRGTGVQIVDADKPALLGVLYVGGYGNFDLSPDGKYYYIAESVWTRGNRGTRQDLLSVYDATTLELLSEIDLPGRLASTPKSPNFAISATGKYGYIFNLEPAASVVMVDLAKREMLSNIEIPACGMIYPFKDDGFASLCGNGALATVMVDSTGKGEVNHSKPFFDADNDPVFDESVVDRSTGQAYFVSYTGMVYPVMLGKTPKFDTPWSMQRAAGLSQATTKPKHETWRPGGTKSMALHKKSGKLFVVMHEGLHWTQKERGTEIWVLDVNTRKLVTRLDVPQATSSIAISQDDDPILFVSQGNRMLMMNPDTGALIRDMRGINGSLMWVVGF